MKLEAVCPLCGKHEEFEAQQMTKVTFGSPWDQKVTLTAFASAEAEHECSGGDPDEIMEIRR